MVILFCLILAIYMPYAIRYKLFMGIKPLTKYLRCDIIVYSREWLWITEQNSIIDNIILFAVSNCFKRVLRGSLSGRHTAYVVCRP